MHTEGSFSPETADAAREQYDRVGSTADVLVTELTRAMGFDKAEYQERVTDDVLTTASEALFAERLQVRIGTREEYEAWRADFDGDVEEIGTDSVDHVAWHAPGFADAAVAATFQDETEAAVGTLRRHAFGELYRPVL